MTRDFRDYLDDMLDFAGKAETFIDQLSWEQFLADEKTQFATVRALEIIGEAARRTPKDFQERTPAIPWQRIIGMRNILTHNYDGIDPRIVYDTVTRFLPELIRNLRAAIEAANKQD